MIDFHNHVLPNVDDGPTSMDESLDMLKYAHKQGIKEIVQTVHFQHPKMEGKNVGFDYLINEKNKLQLEIEKNNLDIKIHLTAEVFYLPNLVEVSKNPLVLFGNKKYMLIEFRSNIFPFGYEKQIFDLQSTGITPVIAHPERYRFVRNNINILNEWINKGYVLQLDAGSLLGNFGKNIEKISQEMIKKGLVHLIGSDAHNNKKRNFCIKQAYDMIKPKHLVEIFKKNSEKILVGDEVISYKGLKVNFINKIYNKFCKLIQL